VGLENLFKDILREKGLDFKNVSRKIQPRQGVRDPSSRAIIRGFLPTNLQLTRASKTAIPLRDRMVSGPWEPQQNTPGTFPQRSAISPLAVCS
jgi:hypothetical protein